MGPTGDLPTIAPLHVDRVEVYPYALKCALVSETLDRQVLELSKRSSAGVGPELAFNRCPPKYADKLLELLIGSLNRQLEEPDKYPYISKLRQSAEQELWASLMRLSRFLAAVPKDHIARRVGNIEALVMLFSKYASVNPPVKNGRASVLQAGSASAESLGNFVGILHHLLVTEFKAHPAYSTTLHRLNRCVRTSQVNASAPTGYGSSIVAHLQRLFDWPDRDHAKLVAGYQPIATGHTCFQEFKKCLTQLERDAEPYLPPEAYPSLETFNGWKSQERSTLSQLITSMSLSNPSFVSDSMGSNTFSPNDYREQPFVFIPKDPRGAYRVLVFSGLCRGLAELGSADLPEATQSLLKDCALRWRLTATFKRLAHFEAVASFFGRGELDFDTLNEAFLEMRKHIAHHPCEMWAAPDLKYLSDIFAFLLQEFMDAFCANLEELTRFPVPLGHAFLDAIDYLLDTHALKEAGVERAAYVDALATKLQAIFLRRYERLTATAAPEAGGSEALNLRLLAKLIMRDIRHAAQLFRAPLLGAIDATGILVGFELNHFTLQAENMLNGRESDSIPVEDALSFYNDVVQLYELGKAHVADLEVGINLVPWFNRQFTRWLAALDGKSQGWVELAIKYDKFVPVSETSLHSSSVDDLVCGFREQLDFLHSLTWPNDLLESRSMAKVAKVIMRASRRMPRGLKGSTAENQGGGITKAQCTVINNIFHLRRRTQELFRDLDYQRYSSVLAAYIKPMDNAPRTRMFYIKVVSAEFLKECDAGKDNDAYAVLSLGSETLLTTTVQWDNATPRWNETCGVALDSPRDLQIRIFDRDLLTDDLCGEGVLRLDPQANWSREDADIWLELEPQGRVLFSISTADEKDDPHYYVTKAIRILEMHEMDLLQSMVANFTGPIKRSLNRKRVLRYLHRRRAGGIPNLLIPHRAPPETSFTDEDCDRALTALADLFDAGLSLPFSLLYEACGCRLVTSVWRECLLAVETSMVPPFSEHRAVPSPLTRAEFEFLMRLVELLKVFFHGGEDADGLPLQMLEIPNYRLLHAIQSFYFDPTDSLIDAYLMAYKSSAASPLCGRPPATYKADVILRVIRMKGDKRGVQFVAGQLSLRLKTLEWARSQRDRSATGCRHPPP
ncbi:hypothetical protein L0F63_006918 [Massospora cicadina]|nr:hypothetical protein L0F63_006918 [Massospora cicadina]